MANCPAIASATSRISKWIDRIARGDGDERVPVALLAMAMAASAVLCLWLGRGTTFSGDEITWIGLAPRLDLGTAFEPHSGHLVVVSHVLYKALLELFGVDYLPFRMLTVGALLAAVAGLFAYARPLVGGWLALAPCLTLLFFGSDQAHILQGNGFTILAAVACGLWALVLLRRADRRGDLAACALLLLGVATYTVALPFLVGAAVVILSRDDRWRRAWVLAVPVAFFLAWRAWLVLDDIDVVRGGLTPIYLLLLPAWTVESATATVSSLIGLNFDFATDDAALPGTVGGPVLGLLAVGAVGWRLSRDPRRVGLWVAIAVFLALLASQVLAYIPNLRVPGVSRYLFPLAFALLLVAVEAVAGLRLRKAWFIAAWVAFLAGFATNLYILQDSADALRGRAGAVRLETTAVNLVDPVLRPEVTSGSRATNIGTLLTEPVTVYSTDAQRKYGNLGFSPQELRARPESERAKVDGILAAAYGLRPVAATGRLTGSDCRVARGGGGLAAVELGPGRYTITAPRTVRLRLGRFAPPSFDAGRLPAGRPMELWIPGDADPQPWKAVARSASLEVCGA